MSKMFNPTVTRSLLPFLLLVFLGTFLMAQEERGSSENIRHRVKALETFYSLSKKYDVSIDQIKKANPGVDYPRAGEYMIIPVKKEQQPLEEPEYIIYTTRQEISIYILARMLRYPVDSLQKWNRGMPLFLPSGKDVMTKPAKPGTRSIIHTVIDERSSLRDLAQLYDVGYRTLKDLNPGLRKRVWYGQKVSVPVMDDRAEHFETIEATGEVQKQREEEEITEEMKECRKNPRNMVRNYRVALLVPFSLERVKEIDPGIKASPSELMDMPSFRFIQFYQGFLMAADTLAQQGLKLDLSVYDVDQDIEKIREVLEKPEMRDMDLVIGPFYKNTFSLAAEFGRKHRIPVVNPLSSREDILEGNNSVYKVQPSIMAQVPTVASLVGDRFYDHNLVIVRENKYQGVDYIQTLRNSLEESLQRQVPDVDYMTDSIAGVRQYLSDIQPNLVIVYSEREVLPVEILPQLHELNEELEIKVLGLPEWKKFEQIENKYLINLNAYLVAGNFIDYLDPGVLRFIERYRSAYYSEPMQYAYDGFDIAYFFLSLLMDYGCDFNDCLHQADYPLLHTHYHFSPSPGGGFVNTYWNVYCYDGYSLMLLPDIR